MSKIKSLCGKCSNPCKDGFTIFANEDEAHELTSKFPYYKIVGSGVATVGKTKRLYFTFKCNKLQADGSCDQYPQNAPAWCKLRS